MFGLTLVLNLNTSVLHCSGDQDGCGAQLTWASMFVHVDSYVCMRMYANVCLSACLLNIGFRKEMSRRV